MKTPITYLPFPAVVGHPTVKRALLLLAIEPRLRGVAFAAPAGSAKSTLARSFADLVPTITVNRDCPCNCAPTLPSSRWCPSCRARSTPGTVETRRAPFLNLPLNLSEDRLLGGIDLEAAVTHGTRRFQTGLLAQANRGVLFVDNLNLLPTHIENILLECLSEGRLRIEREGMSADFPADFSLIAAYNPQEGPVRWHVLDRIGVIVAAPRQPEIEIRRQVVETVHAFERDPEGVRELYREETEAFQALIARGKELLPRVTISDEFTRHFCRRAVDLETAGHRGEVFATLLARANAALDGRIEVEEADVKAAEFYVLLPRATRVPQEEEEEQPPPPPPETENQDDTDEPPPPPPTEQQDIALVFDLEEARLDYDFDFFSKSVRAGRYGKRSEQENFRSGRHVRSVGGDIARGKLAVEATLRQAAPYQRRRRDRAFDRGDERPRIHIEKDDIRIKKYRRKAGALMVFIVDASGSMAVNRMGQAKGAIVELLRQSYVSRDKVALIACQGAESRLLLAPTQSVEAAKRQLEKLPTGGGTPLSDAMRRAFALIDETRRAGTYSEAVVVVLSDGRGNVPAKRDPNAPPPTKDQQQAAIQEEMEDLARLYVGGNLKTVVIDTQNQFVSRGEAKKLAELLGGRYVYLPRLSAGQIAGTVKSVLDR